jgi:hypothetical protein
MGSKEYGERLGLIALTFSLRESIAFVSLQCMWGDSATPLPRSGSLVVACGLLSFARKTLVSHCNIRERQAGRCGHTSAHIGQYGPVLAGSGSMEAQRDNGEIHHSLGLQYTGLISVFLKFRC